MARDWLALLARWRARVHLHRAAFWTDVDEWLTTPRRWAAIRAHRGSGAGECG